MEYILERVDLMNGLNLMTLYKQRPIGREICLVGLFLCVFIGKTSENHAYIDREIIFFNKKAENHRN